MKKIIRPLLYILASFLLVMIVLFSVYAQRDIPVEKLKLKYAQSPSKFLPMMGMQVHYRDEGNPNDLRH